MYDALHIDVEATGPASCRVTVAGELNVSTAEEFRIVLRTAVHAYRHIVMDLGALRLCDCSGLSALLSASRTARASGAELRLRAVPHSLARTLHLVGAHGAFAIEPGLRPLETS